MLTLGRKSIIIYRHRIAATPQRGQTNAELYRKDNYRCISYTPIDCNRRTSHSPNWPGIAADRHIPIRSVP